MTTNYQAAEAELSTLRDFLRWTTSRFEEARLFFGHGNNDAFNEATQLVLHSLKLPVTELPEIFLDARLCSDEKQILLNLVKRRVEERVPVPYLTHEAWFAGLPFYVDERVLIPRSPFAELIESQFSPWLLDVEGVERILDMCTGSACIAIALAMAFEGAEVDAVDISEEALAVAQINKNKHLLGDELTIIQSDLWSELERSRQYDLIVSNPPYVGDFEMASLPAEYHHEPVDALQAEDNGLALVEQIIIGAAKFLTPHGLLFVEVGNSDLAVDERWPETHFLWLELEQGGHGIFMLTHKQCVEFASVHS
ncbi:MULTISPECIES: 50S ribosomal protein L3 N(5)-glutamine methyltransferase [unclassified Methylophaga]|uniref:50S ribosomal protein L3 N(5)-glutamine methyltransferase n=1 Tax=unclassified Methylophaga TaxID=2629249 RepID=UPI000C96CF44|nr:MULTISPECIES: 50S ribosomal protein L3 N(5)-glutamine methyltransferase [unclassified Methylophaga]MBN46663.1 50S ribosomal protein L3 N(5)-glutamine methyltransferase [Methylophaga sp.]|tara:strand:+ start:3835 stop:4764 length:930 start_codon:yes stop_codon:yes gene_type:complete